MNPFSVYTLTNKNGMEVTLTDLGATVMDIRIPGSDLRGEARSVVLGYPAPEDYLEGQYYFGAMVGRYANRIKGGVFELDGVSVQMEQNEFPNTLHGGFDLYSKRIWAVSRFSAEEGAVTFHLESPDGDQGLPGRARIDVSYRLTDSNRLVIHYQAVSDKTTVFNLTNHSYFNLNGSDAESAADHDLRMFCEKYTPTDAELIPTGEILSVTGTQLDFNAGKKIGSDFVYDHNYVITAPSLTEPFAVLHSEKTGITLRAYTDLPAVQVYTGNRGVCLETQFFPDSPNHPNFPSTVFQAGQIFDRTTIYEFLF
ncbi:aldose 1-epimerase [Clostridia bacterium]|nr:aldose 1-epimerase [Clostridia bacterium]